MLDGSVYYHQDKLHTQRLNSNSWTTDTSSIERYKDTAARSHSQILGKNLKATDRALCYNVPFTDDVKSFLHQHTHINDFPPIKVDSI